MWEDTIIEEIHRNREEYAKSFNYDLELIFEDLQKKQAASGRKIISGPLNQSSQRSNKSTSK